MRVGALILAAFATLGLGLGLASESSPGVTYEYVDVGDGVQLSVGLAGELKAPTSTLVLVHGFPEGSFAWDDMVEPLTKLLPTTKILMPNLRGYNTSSHPAVTEGNYDTPKLVTDLISLLGQQEAPCHLVAHDWGGIISWFAAGDPEGAKLISSYTVIDSPHPNVMVAQNDNSDVWDLILSYANSNAVEKVLSADDYLVASKLMIDVFKAEWFEDGAVAQIYKDSWAATDATTGITGLEGGLNVISATNLTQWEVPLVVYPPVQVLWGTADVVFPNYTALVAGLTPDIVPNLVDVIYYENTSHWVMHDVPELASAAIAGFIMSIDGQ